MCPVTLSALEMHITGTYPAFSPRVKFLVAEYKQYSKHMKYIVYEMMINAKERKQSVGVEKFSFYPYRFFAGIIIK